MDKKESLLTQTNSNGRVKFMKLTLEGPTLSREWGLVDGKVQTTSHTYSTINAGKKNELSPEKAAEADFIRIRNRKIKEGYGHILAQDEGGEVWVDTSGNIGEETKTLTFETIPTELCVSKPISKLNENKVVKAMVKNKVQYQVKYNGLCHYVLCTPEGKIKLYTRRMDDHTAKYPSIVKALERDKELFPPSSIFVGELCVDPTLNMPHMEAFKRACEIARVDTLEGKLKNDQSEALIRQSKTTVRLAIYSVLYYGGEQVAGKCTHEDIYFEHLIKLPEANSLSPYFKPEVLQFESLEQAKQFLKDNPKTHEGLVAWMMNEKMEVTFTGKPLRRAAYKVKVAKEDDVIAYGYEEGKGDKQGKIGSLLIGKLNTEGEMVPLGNCGSGLTDEQCDPATWEFPQVVEIIYNEVFPTGKYQFPRFSKKHEDKVPSEVVI